MQALETEMQRLRDTDEASPRLRAPMARMRDLQNGSLSIERHVGLNPQTVLKAVMRRPIVRSPSDKSSANMC